MPNYCNNNLTIKGDVKSMREFYDYVGPLDRNFNMTNLLPMPTELENTHHPVSFHVQSTKEILSENGTVEKIQINENNQTEQEFMDHCKYLEDKYGADNWYDWCYENWGCKWDIDDLSIDSQTDEEACISYVTAWNPNYEFISSLGLKFPNLTFELEYDEPLMELAGTFIVKNDTCDDIDWFIKWFHS